MPARPTSKQPRDYCTPREAFGNPAAIERYWVVPLEGQEEDLKYFRAAVVQHAYAIAIRRNKNSLGMTQRQFAAADDRYDDITKWNARLNGRVGFTFRDLAAVVGILEGFEMPTTEHLRTLLAVAEKRIDRPDNWEEIDE